MNKETCRGIKDAKFWASLVEGKLTKLLEAIKADSELVLQFRNDYLNVYYHSGNVAKINSEKSVEISENYFISCDEDSYDRSMKSDEDRKKHDRLIKWRNETKQLFYDGKYTEYFSRMKETMQKYWNYYHPEGHEDEGDVQQELSLNNQYFSKRSKYTIIDLEHEVSINADFCYKGTTPFPKKNKGKIVLKEKPRFDIVAVNKKTGQLHVWELKKGVGALYGSSGMHDHVDSFLHTIKKNEDAEKSFIEEMEYILMQKQILGLIDKRLKINKKEKVEFGFIYTFSDANKKNQQEERTEVEKLRGLKLKNISISEYPIIYLGPNEYTLK